MAFSLTVTGSKVFFTEATGGVIPRYIDQVISLTNGNPYRLESAEGLSGAPVRRHQQRSPFQHGYTDLGYRLQPRDITLNILFYASDAGTADIRRQALQGIFAPFAPLRLRAVRDDNKARVLDCHAVGEISIDVLPENRPGNLHRATVRLRAANPLWRSDAPGTVTANAGGTAVVVNNGDVPVYSAVIVQGAIYDPVIVNQTNLGTIDLTGVSLISTHYRILVDMRTGNKTITRPASGDNILSNVTAVPIDIANWHLSPGTNYITMTGGSIWNSTFSVIHTNQYLSF